MLLKENTIKSGRAGGYYRYIAYFWKFVQPLWPLGLSSLFLMAISTALSSLLPLSVKLLIDFIIMKRPLHDISYFLSARHLGIFSELFMQLASSLNLMIIAIITTSILIGIIGIIEKLMIMRFQQAITYTLHTSLFEHVLRFPLSIIKQKQVGYLMSRVSDDVDMMQYLFSWLLPQFTTSFFFSIFGFLVLYGLDHMVAIILFLLMPLIIIIHYLFASRVRAASHSEMERNALVSKEMHEVISGAEVVKAFTAEKKAVENISGKLRQFFSSNIYSGFLNALSTSFNQQAKLGVMLVVIVLGVRRIEGGSMTVGDFTTIMAYIVYLSGQFTGISSSLMSFQPVLASMERIKEMFETIPEFAYEEQACKLYRPVEIKGHIVYSGVTFSYQQETPLLDSISFSVKPGQVLVITGESGSGKTTLINLLLKFHNPQKGCILIDGRDIGEIDTEWLRKQIGVVSQDVFLFNDTVENNIRYGNPSADRRAVMEAAKQALIHDFIETLPQGYQTMMGERGVTFSLGQRQRISIARAFLKNPAILILDEPSSALDMATEEQLKDSLSRLTRNRTTLIISHRMNLIKGLNAVQLEI